MLLQNITQLEGREREYLLDCLESNWISSEGKYVQAFEQCFADYCGVRFGVACSSGTAAIHLALLALGIGAGDEVIVPDFTLIADANMVILSGARPVFVDVDPETWCLDLEQFRRKITPRTKAVLCVHMYGHPCDMDGVRAIAREHGLFVIEDAAQAHGSTYRGRKAGSLGDLACFSFYATKTLTTGEGGMVLTDNPEWAERAVRMRSHGFEGDGRVYVHRLFGCNYRLTNLQAALGLAQCERVEEKVAAKRRILATYRELLQDFEPLRFQAVRPWAGSTFWNVGVLLQGEGGPSCQEVTQQLKEKGIQTRFFFNALHRQPLFQDSRDPRFPRVDEPFPVSDYLSDHGLCLPSGLSLTREQISRVVEALKSCWS
jgi:perosamine synthetase